MTHKEFNKFIKANMTTKKSPFSHAELLAWTLIPCANFVLKVYSIQTCLPWGAEIPFVESTVIQDEFMIYEAL